MRKTSVIMTLILGVFLVLPVSALAYTVKANDSVYVAADEVVEGNLYVAGKIVTVDGYVKGDVICAGQNVQINGEVEGDVICAGQNVQVNGKVGGNVRVAGNTINIDGLVGKNVNSFGTTIVFGQNTSIGWDALVAGETGDFRGKIGGNLHGAVENIIIAGEVAKNVDFRLGGRNGGKSIDLKNSAVIGGDLKYKAFNAGLIDPAAKIGGQTEFKTIDYPSKKDYAIGYASTQIFSIFSALVIALVLLFIARKPLFKIFELIEEKTWSTIGWGLVFMFLTPIVAIILMVTLIGFPLALIILALWLILLYLSKIIAGIWFGKFIFTKIFKQKIKENSNLIWPMILGIFVSWIVFSVPFIGCFLALIAICSGLGAFCLCLKKS